MAIIERGDDSPITQNFTFSEYYSKSSDAPDIHGIDDNLVYAMQYIRSYFGHPIRITSTYRTFLHSLSIGSNPYTSQHRYEKAIDWQFIGTDEDVKELHNNFYNDIITQGEVFQKLNNDYNIKGFGLYDTFFHIDTRENESTSGTTWNTQGINGSYSLWDKKKKV